MEAKQTVMSKEERIATGLGDLTEDERYRRALCAQADISFKAGYEQKCFETYEAGCKDGNQKGMRKVVEWLENNKEHIDGFPVINAQSWQSFLKDNNLETGCK